MTPASDRPQHPATLFLSTLLAWVVPGLGHWIIGEKKRGLIVGLTILTLFIMGLLIGGVGVIDRKNEFLWYCGQVMVGPIAIAVDRYHAPHDSSNSHQGHTHWDGPDPSAPGQPPPAYSTSIGRMNELGTLYTTLAGVLNLLAILDLIGREQPGTAGRRAVSPDKPAGAAGRIVTRET